MSGLLALFVLVAWADCPFEAAPLDLGETTGLSAYTVASITGTNVSIEGPVAAGFGVGLRAFDLNLGGSGVAAEAGYAISLQDGVVHGDLSWGAFANLTSVVTDGASAGGATVDPSGTLALLQAESARLNALPSNGTTRRSTWGGLQLRGTAPGLNVFDVDAGVLSSARVVQVDVPAGATVIVNVHGIVVHLADMSVSLLGVAPDHLLWNLNGAPGLRIERSSVAGTFLGWLADMIVTSSSVEGSLIGRSLRADGVIGYAPFSAVVDTCTEAPAPVASCVARQRIQSAWLGADGAWGFTGGVEVRWTGDDVDAGTLDWTFPGGETVTQLWSGVWSQVGADVHVEQPAWGDGLSTGEQVYVGFQGTSWTSPTAPPAVRVNGVLCTAW